MYMRTASTVLIATIIACPLLCRNGLCQGCCAAEQSSQLICPVHGTAHCCCPTTSHDGDGQRPCDDGPCKSSCQGVCGGAVIEKSNDFPVAADAWFLPLSDTSPCLASLLAARQSRADECRFDCSTTPGRSIRTLHMSFLC